MQYSIRNNNIALYHFYNGSNSIAPKTRVFLLNSNELDSRSSCDMKYESKENVELGLARYKIEVNGTQERSCCDSMSSR